MSAFGSAFIVYRECYNPLFQWRDQDEGLLKLVGKRLITEFAIPTLPIALIAEMIYHVVMWIFCALKNSMPESNRHLNLTGYSFLVLLLSPIEVLSKLISNIFCAQISPSKSGHMTLEKIF
jgi:hypothetical protein